MLTQAHVGRFEIRDFLGRGAIGDVYLARDPKIDGEVALKLVRTAKTDPEMVAAERNGTALQAALSRVAPQVAAVYEQGDQDGFYWVAMEYVAGDDLAAVIEREAPFEETRALSIALQLCEMLEMFHDFSGIDGRRGIVHGDLKPENIRIQDGDKVRVLDFGIAKHLSQTRRFTVNLFGSLPYTPPERLTTGRVDAQSDLWAVGVILYTMVAGYPPYSGRDAEEVETRIRRGDPPSPLPESVSPGLKKVVYRALAADPARRYPSAAAFRADLEALRSGQPLPIVPGPEEPAAPRDDLNATRRTTRPLDDSRAGLGETRRTDRPAVDLDSTRRTYEPEPASSPVLPPPPVTPAPDLLESVPGPQPEPVRPRRRKRWAMALAGALLILFGMSQFWIRSEAQELQRMLVTDTDPDLGAVLARYRQVSWLGMFNPTMGEVRDELREALVASADRILEGYHGDYPRVRERGWRQAYEYLQGAAELNYLDRKVRAKMHYAKAHLDRIESQTLKQRGERDAANEKIDTAVAGFREAARRDGSWPDPYLGLARVYAYERPNLDELQKSLVELEKRGYRLGKREKTMEADGYRMRAEELWARAQRARGTDGEMELLEQTRDSLLQAINFYEEAPGYADVRTNLGRAHSRLNQVQSRIHALESPPGILDEIEDIFGEGDGGGDGGEGDPEQALKAIEQVIGLIRSAKGGGGGGR